MGKLCAGIDSGTAGMLLFSLTFLHVIALVCSCPLCPEEVAWASKTKRTLQPVGNRCLPCVATLQKAWPAKAWDEVVQEASVSESFKREVAEAVAVFEKKTTKKFTAEEYEHATLTGYEIYREYLWYSPKEFASTFGCDAATAGAPVETLADEAGNKMQGIIVLDDSCNVLRIRSFHKVHGQTSALLQTREGQLRAHQAQEFAKVYESEVNRSLPKGLLRPSSCLKKSALPEIVRAAVAEAQRVAEEKAHLEEMKAPDLDKVAEEQPEQAEPQCPEDDDDDAEADVRLLDAPLLPSQQAKVSTGKNSKDKKKKKGDGAKAGKLSPRKERKSSSMTVSFARSAAASAASSLAGSDDKDDDGQSRRSQGSLAAKSHAGSSWKLAKMGRTSSREKLLEKARGWLETIPITKILSGEAWGHRVWQAGETLRSLSSTHKCQGHSDVVLLSAHLDLAKEAQELSATTVYT